MVKQRILHPVAGFGKGNIVLNKGVQKGMSDYKPPFHITDRITNLVAAISEQN